MTPNACLHRVRVGESRARVSVPRCLLLKTCFDFFPPQRQALEGEALGENAYSSLFDSWAKEDTGGDSGEEVEATGLLPQPMAPTSVEAGLPSDSPHTWEAWEADVDAWGHA